MGVCLSASLQNELCHTGALPDVSNQESLNLNHGDMAGTAYIAPGYYELVMLR